MALIHVITGDGKGKTTAAFGLALRSGGRGKKVVIIQFLKTDETGEVLSAKKIDEIKVYRFETYHGFIWDMNEEEKKRLKKEIEEAFSFAKNIAESKKCELLILDEVFACINNNMLSKDDFIDFLKNVSSDVEIVLTGRDAPKEIIECADYVSEIMCRKHPYEKGIPAREGIEY